MNMQMNKFNPAKTRKFKYGATAVILTAVTIAAVVIINAIFSALAYNNNWYIDLTKEKIYGLSDAGRAILDEIDDEINIHFLTPFDQLEADGYTKMVFELVKEMASSYDNISYDYIDMISNPTAVNKYKTTTATNIGLTDVIVECGTEFRVFKLRALFMFNQNDSITPWAFNGEKKLVTAISQVTQAETPIAYFTVTHGEYITQEMIDLFYDAGYLPMSIDLTKEDFDPDGRLLVISNPIYDFEGISKDTEGRKCEIEKIDDFLDGFNSVMVFTDPDTEELPELYEFLTEWGISFEDAVLKDPSNSIDTEHYSLVGQYPVEETLGASLTSQITGLGTPPKAIVRYARPIELLWTEKDNRMTSTVLYSSENAEKYVDGEKVDEGRYPLVTLTRETRIIENTYHYSYLFAIGSQYFTSSDYLSKKTYSNSDIIHAMMIAMGKAQVPVDLDPKMFENEALDITTQDASSWTIFLTIVIPACFLIAGIVIWIRRKHA